MALTTALLAGCGDASFDKEDAANYAEKSTVEETEAETEKTSNQKEKEAEATKETTTEEKQATQSQPTTPAPTVPSYQQMSGYVYVATGRVDDGLNLRQGPGVKYDKVLSYEMPNGTMLLLEGKQGDWYKVAVEGSHVEGWVNSKYTSTHMPSYTENHYDTIYVAIYGDTLALRTGPSPKYGKIGDLVYSEPLYVYRTSGKWSYVYAPSQEAYGWVNSSYTLSSLEDTIQETSTTTMTVNVHNDTLVLRSEPSKNSLQVDRLENGTVVYVEKEQGVWYSVYVPSTRARGWVHSAFLK